MISIKKAIISLFISSSVVGYYHTQVDKLPDLVILSPFLILYCLGDLKNSRDMILHHLATIMLNLSFFFVNYNLHRLNEEDQQDVSEITSAFFLVETSTIPLAFMHLGYRSLPIRLAFLGTFVYYRIFYLSYLLRTRYQTRFIRVLCDNSNFCKINWYVGSTGLVILNYYWLCLILLKICKKKNRSIKIS